MKHFETPSPVAPSIGRTVGYRGGLHSVDKEDRPAIITHVHTGVSGDVVDLTVFSPTGVNHVSSVAYSKEHAYHSWHWLPQAQVRTTPPPVPVPAENGLPGDALVAAMRPETPSPGGQPVDSSSAKDTVPT